MWERNRHQSNTEFSLSIINLKIDWIRDETFIYSQIFNLVEEKLDFLARKFGLWNNRKFILDSCYFIDSLKYSNDNKFRNDKELAMQVLKEKAKLQFTSHKLRKDKEIVKIALKSSNGTALEYASKKLQDDKEIVKLALESSWNAYTFASKRLQNDREVVYKAVSHGGKIVSYISDKFNNDRELLLETSKICGLETLKYASSELRSDKELVLQAIQQNPRAFEFASEELKIDRVFVKEVMIKGECLKYASKEFCDDSEIVELALKSYPDAIHFISDRLRFSKDNEFISKVIGKKGFNQLPGEFSNDREIVLESIKINPSNLNVASMELQNDREFILQVAKNCGMVIAWVKEEFKSDREIVMEAVKQNGLVLRYVNEEFKSDREIITIAITQNGYALQYAHDLFEDKEIILKAAQTATNYYWPKFYSKLSDRLKNDRELFMKCGVFFDYFPRKYQLDREIVMECLKTHPDSVLRNSYPLVISDRVFALRIVKRNGLLLGKLPFKYRNDREIVSFASQQNKMN